LDDFCIYGKKENHLGKIEKAFERMQEERASLNQVKCIFGCSKGVILGYVVSKCGIETNP